MVTLEVDSAPSLELVLDTGTAFSVLRDSLRRSLQELGVLTETSSRPFGRPIYRLQGLSIEGQDVPDVDFVVSNHPALLDIDGMLGLNFLALFSLVQFDTDTRRVTLTRRA